MTSVGSASPRSELSAADVERIQKFERRVVGMAQKQAERQVMEEFRYRKHEEKWQAVEKQCQDHLNSTRQMRLEAAAKRKARHDEVSSRRHELQGALASSKERKVVEQDVQICQRGRLQKQNHEHRMQARKQEQSEKSRERAERLKGLEEQREMTSQQKLQAYEEKHARMQARQQQKAELRWQVNQIWAKTEEWKTYTKKKLAAGKHEELIKEIREIKETRMETSSPARGSIFAESPKTCSFKPPARTGPPQNGGDAAGPDEDDGMYDALMSLFEAKVKIAS